MANFSKIWPAGLTNGVDTIDETELEDLDTDHTKTINATDGSTHAPTAKVTIGGEGIGGNLPDGEWWQLGADAGAKRTIVTGMPAGPTMRLLNGSALVLVGFVQGQGLGEAFTRAIDCVPAGATITLIKCFVSIKNTHAGLPASFPMMTVRRITRSTQGLATYLKTTDAGAGVNESFVGAPVASTAAYNALGVFAFTYTPDQNNVVDKSLYDFVIAVIDEAGANAVAGNIFGSFEITFTETETRNY